MSYGWCYMPFTYLSNKTKLSAIALVILTIQQNGGYCDDDGGCVELDCDADVLMVMIVFGDHDGNIPNDVSGVSL